MARRKLIRGITTDRAADNDARRSGARPAAEKVAPEKEMTLVDTNVVVDILTGDPNACRC
jgi:hypothetical protein